MLLFMNKRGQDMSKGKRLKKVSNFFKHPIPAGVIVLFIWAIISSAQGLFKLPDRVENIEKDIEEINGRLDSLEADMKDTKEKVSNIDNRVSSLEGRLSAIENTVNFIMDNSAIYIGEGSRAIQTSIGTSTLSVKDADIIAVSATGREYTAKELQNKRIITSYTQDGYEVIFCGQYNEKYHWHGVCVRNSYKDGALAFAEVATYDDGKRTYNDQLFPDGDTFVYARRIQDGNINIGDSWKYKKTSDIKQEIAYDEPEEKDLIIPEIYIKSLPEYISHYHGDTSDGQYNDDTGEAYLVTYKDGYVRTLYSGRFKNGQFEDSTGEAWYITIDDGTEYMYFKGRFTGGHPAGDGEKENPVTAETVERVTSGRTFTDKLTWNMAHIKQ